MQHFKLSDNDSRLWMTENDNIIEKVRSSDVSTYVICFKKTKLECGRQRGTYFLGNSLGLLHHPFWLRLVFRHFWVSIFNHLLTTLFGLGSLTRVQYPKCAYGPYC